MSATVLNHRYRLDEPIGEGGMAVVYRGQDLLLNRQVAIKILRPQYAADSGFLKRFEREAQAAAGFSHPNIVNVYDVGADQTQHYIVMEYIRGPNLKELIRRHGPFSVDGAIFIIGQVASALEYAHRRELVHRDIKPQNILVDREGNAKVVDFGIAKGVRDTSLTDAGTGMGTVHYVSPEQARGEPATPASDLYSTGVVLYEMLTKRLPFEADTPIGVAMQHVNQAPPPPSQFNPAIPPKIEALIMRAMAKDPADRFPSAGAFAHALRHWDAPEEVRTETETLPAPGTAQQPPEPVVIRPQQQIARARQPAPRAAAGPPRGTRKAQRPVQRDPIVRDDVGCATWLIGSAILIAVIGLVVLAFRVLPGLLDGDEVDPRTSGQELPTPTIAAATPTPTLAPTATIPVAVPTLPLAATPANPAAFPTPTTASSLAETPQFVGMSLAEAEALVAGRWELVVLEEHSDAYAPGEIMAQSPEAGAAIAEGEQITLIISLGPALADIPEVSGWYLADAIDALITAGFDYATVEEPSIDVAEGLVIRTEPAGAATPGSTIVIVVSLGDVVVVPDVRGLDLETATAELNAAGLLVGNVYTSGCDAIVGVNPSFDCASAPDGGVAIMSATPYLYVERGTVVDLVLYSADL